jgi:CNT family concentrative nucleoside transporter
MGNKLAGVVGLVVFLLLAWMLSQKKRLFPWRTVACGLTLQIGFAVFILRTSVGKEIFNFIQYLFNKLTEASAEGTSFVFGPLASSSIMSGTFGPAHGFVFAISVTGSIVIVSALSSLFYHYGILQRVVHFMAVIMQKTMKTSGSESLAAAVNMFVGQTESALVIKLYLEAMTASEIMALMTIGMATIASGIMVTYTSMGMAAGHLLTASVMSAPGALLIAKIMLPETQKSETASSAKIKSENHTVNGIDAICRGAGEGMNIAINVMAMLIAFIAAVWLVNHTLTWLQHHAGVANPVTLEKALGWVNAPFAWLMGIQWSDCTIVGQLLGKRILLNEFVSYLDLSTMIGMKDANPLSPRSVVIATYALCGFANFSSIAIQIGGIGAIAPNRRADLARYGFRAMIGGLLTCYLSATIAGLMID